MSYVNFNDSFFDGIMRSAEVETLCESKARAALEIARANAPVDTGAYLGGLRLETADHRRRRTFMVVGHDRKTLLVESRTGNLARALRAVR